VKRLRYLPFRHLSAGRSWRRHECSQEEQWTGVVARLEQEGRDLSAELAAQKQKLEESDEATRKTAAALGQMREERDKLLEIVSR